MKKNEENFKRLEELKLNKAKEINYYLELFQGSLSLTDIMNYDICFLSSLKDAKEQRNQDIAAARAKMQREAQERQLAQEEAMRAKRNQQRHQQERATKRGKK